MPYGHGMDTTVLRWFQQVADGVTVTQVSEIENVTQSGVSRALARLDAEVGTPLLRRTGRTLRMTAAGTAFKHHVDAMMHQLDDGLAAVDQLVDPETGTVALAFHPSLGTWLVPDLVRSFRRLHPRVQFSLTQVRDDPAESALPDREVELEISAIRPADAGTRWARLLAEPLRLAVPAEHRLAGGADVHLQDLAEEPFVALRRTSRLRQLGDELCAEVGFRPGVAFEGDDLPTVRGFVAAGLGVAIVPSTHTGSVTDAGPVSYLEISGVHAVREIGLTWSADRRLLPAAEVFRRHVSDRARSGSLASLL